VKPILEEKAWTLFIKRLGHDITLCPEVEQIAKSITKECDGLPLGIITMAGAMKGVDDINEWRNALEDLRQLRVRQDDMEEDVFPREDLIAYLIDEGVIKRQSRVAEVHKGHSMLNKLENVSLLESATRYGDRSCVPMHDLIRDMAIQLQQENSQAMVKSGAQLNELPDTEEWTENLVRVSLIQNQIEEIPSSYSPRCPSLSTLLSCTNKYLKFIAESFFKKLHGLKVLDLSCTLRICLILSFDLVSLCIVAHCL
jgi:disease resistance protein RPS2